MDKLKWWQKTMVYQIYPKSFYDSNGDGIGDLTGITQKLSYIHNLGAGAIWLTPMYSSSMIDNGYDVSDYRNIAPEYGTMADMEALIHEAKKYDIRILLDLVFNHTSDEHVWFQESRKSLENDKRDWYIWRDAKPDGSPPTNWRGIFGGSAWTLDECTGQYYLHTFAAKQPDLNWENVKVRQAMYDIAEFWLDKGVGGFRIDAITYIKKPAVYDDLPIDGPDRMGNVHQATANQSGILDFLQEFKQAVFTGKDIVTVAEANGVKAEELKYWVGETGIFDMLFEFSHISLDMEESSLWYQPIPWKLTQLKRALSESQRATSNNGWYPAFFENHDQPRSINHFFPEAVDAELAAKVLATVLLTLKGTPFIYEGQELGMTNTAWPSIQCYDDISSHGQYQLARQAGLSDQEALRFIQKYSRDNARTPMQWNNQKNAGFTTGKPWLPVNENYRNINVACEQMKENSVFNYYKKLAELRKNYEALLQGRYQELLKSNESIYAYLRILPEQTILIICNFSDKQTAYELPRELIINKLLMGTYADAPENRLRSYEARIYLCEGSNVL
ncbi:glycoside hydrolase family 13 protein [Propionispira raffinosivorans]|uniref:glycoside hydrolase family 13 protein n=1 Tax=Propionispira raffinosivorans TaxID=86959 RepID=UPI0003810BAB|nr:alpha-glucosidase [Propionispira raffinosivorans]